MASVPRAASGGRRTRRDAGISSTQAAVPMASIAVRQSMAVRSHPASGEIVMEPIPMPAETRAAARLRRCSSQAVAAAIIGA